MSAGLLLFRRRRTAVEVLLGHPGGPYFAKRDEGIWTIPKGLVEPEETLFDAARREFLEETGLRALPEDEAQYIALGEVRYKSRKSVHGWALRGECDVSALHSNVFSLEWPPRSGQTIEVPEIDRFGFFPIELAVDKVHPAQLPFFERLLAALGGPRGDEVFSREPADLLPGSSSGKRPTET